MFITENQNVGDSVLFLLSSREALANIVEHSKTENADSLVKFIYNEASDYEIMHLLLNGSLPEEKYNDVAEMILFSEFKQSMLINKDFVTEIVGEDIFDNILNEVDCLYMAGSTARPVLEFLSQDDMEVTLAMMVSEQGGNIGNVARAAARQKSKMAAAGRYPSAPMAGQTSKITLWKSKLAAAVKAGKADVAAKYKSMIASAKAELAKATSGAKGVITGKGGRAAPTTGAKIKAAAKHYGGKVAVAAKTPITVGGKAVTVGGKTVTAGAAAGGAAGAALAIYAGAKVYKRFFSQAAKACGGQSGAAKTQCMGKYKKQAIMKQASAIQSASGSCAKSGNPEKCKAGIAKKVQSLKAKAARIAA